MSEERRRRSEAFYGRRKTRGLSDRKSELSRTLLPELRIELANPIANASELFNPPRDSVHLEIGFGGGEHLLHRARSEPDIGLIGVEPFVNGMAQLLAHLAKETEGRGRPNLRVYDEDAVELLDALPEGTLDRIDLLYPDPWPKRKHWKRRFVNERNLDRIVRALRPGGEFRFASDITSYVDWTLHHADRNGHLRWLAAKAEDWGVPWEGWIRTRYEAKAVREGRTPCYLRFERFM